MNPTHPPVLDDVVFADVPVIEPVACGVDLSLTGTGISVVHSDGSIRVHTIGSKGSKDDSTAARAARLDALVDQIVEAVPADVAVCVEGPSYGSHGGSTHIIAGLWWLSVVALRQFGHKPHIVPPATLKVYATGNGAASKAMVIAAAVRRYPNALIENDNEADATVLAAIASRHAGLSLDDPTQKQLDALRKVEWAA